MARPPGHTNEPRKVHKLIASLWPRFQLLAPGLAAATILAAFTFTTPIIQWIGPETFLLVPNLYLFIYPGKISIGRHFEAVALCLLGGFIGLGLCFLAVCGTVWVQGPGVEPYSDIRARAISECTLLGITFLGGWGSSAYPRFKVSVRALLLFGSWILTTGASQISWSVVSGYWYTLCLTAGVSLLTKAVVFPSFAGREVTDLLIENLETTCECIDHALQAFLGATKQSSVMLQSTRDKLSATVSKLPGAFEQASQEFHLGRVPTSTYHDLVEPMRKIRTWAATGMVIRSSVGLHHSQMSRNHSSVNLRQSVAPGEEGPASHHNEEESPSVSPALRSHVTALASEVTHSLRLVQQVLQLIADSERIQLFSRFSLRRRRTVRKADLPGTRNPLPPERYVAVIICQRRKLAAAISTFSSASESILATLRSGAAPKETILDLDGPQISQPATTLHSHHDNSLYETAFFMMSLLEVSKEVENCIVASQRYLACWQASIRWRVFSPKLRWSKWASRTSGIDSVEDNLIADEREEVSRAAVVAGVTTESELYQRIFRDGDEETHRFTRHMPLRQTRQGRLWHRPTVIKVRLAASAFILTLRRDRHIKYGLKLATGVTLLSLPAWLPESRTWYLPLRGVWSLLSYIWIFEATSAATLRLAAFRLVGTIAGVIFGLTAYEISQRNPFALTFVQTIFLVPSAHLITESKNGALGLIIGVASSLVTGVAYVDPIEPSGDSSASSALSIAITRGVEVVVGIVAAVIVNLTVWPYHARVECVATLSETTSKINNLYTLLARQLLQAGLLVTGSTKERFEKMERALERKLAFARALISIMNAEVSLVIKPIGTLTNIVGHLEKIIFLLSALRQCREQGLRLNHHEAINTTFDERQNVVSSISLSFWAVSQALATRAPLPQFLPSPRAAVGSLNVALHEALAEDDPKSADVAAAQCQGASDAVKFVPQAYYALMRAGDPLQWRGKNGSPTLSGTSSPLRPHSHTQFRNSGSHVPSAFRAPPGNTPRHQLSPTSPPGIKSDANHIHFWILAELSLLYHIVDEIELLMDETRNLCGEVTFVAVDEPVEGSQQSQHEQTEPPPLGTSRYSLSSGTTVPASSSPDGEVGHHPDHRQRYVGQMEPLTEAVSNTPDRALGHQGAQPRSDD